MLSGNRHASINGGLGDIDGASCQADGAAYGAVANRQALTSRDDIAVDGRVIQVKALTGPVQIALDAGWTGIPVGHENIARAIGAGECHGGERGKRQRDKREGHNEASAHVATLRRRGLVVRHGESFAW